MLKRTPICPPIIKGNYNNNNFHEYDPYMLQDDCIVIDPVWFLSLTTHIQHLITSRLTFKLQPITIPHVVQQDNEQKMLKIVYDSYLEGFDYHVWYDKTIPNINTHVNMIKIPNTVKTILSDMFKGRKVDDDLTMFKNEISQFINGEAFFIRLSSTSGKNEQSIKKLYTVDQIIKHLTSNKLFVFQEYDVNKDTHLIMIPWNKKIKPKYEFRIFVVDHILTGASIQQWFNESIQHTTDELEICQKALSSIPFLKLPYKTFIADVYVDMETKQCHLIEVNPFGAHCGAGSSLFNWITDYDMLHGQGEAEMRYLSCINY